MLYRLTKVAVRIYKAMIVQKHRLSSIDRRAKQIIGGEENLKSIEAVIKKDACTFVKKKCINNKLCENFEKLLKHYKT